MLLVILEVIFIPDIKEKQPIKTVAKERRTTVPKELMRRGTAEMAVKAKQQIMEASRGGQAEEQEAQQTGLGMLPERKWCKNAPHKK